MGVVCVGKVTALGHAERAVLDHNSTKHVIYLVFVLNNIVSGVLGSMVLAGWPTASAFSVHGSLA